MKTLALLFALAISGMAHASTVTFSAFTANSSNPQDITTSATLSATASSFTITLTNNTSTGFISAFYLEIGDALQGVDKDSATISNGPGTKFSPNGGGPNPGGGIHSTVGGSWEGSFFRMKFKKGAANGIHLNETVSITFDLDGAFDLDALTAAMANNEIRMAQHYQGWTNGDSEWLVNNTPPGMVVVPLPPAAWAGLGTLGLLAGARALKRRKA